MKKVAIIGTHGVPANYGGFETLVENIIGINCPEDVEYTVFCSTYDEPEHLKTYKGAKLKYVRLRANGVQSILYDFISMLRSMRGYDVMLIFGVSGCVFIPLIKVLSRIKIIVNIDGLEHRREKWGKFAKWFLRKSEAIAVRNADITIADSTAIREYVLERYNRPATVIAYGGDHVYRNVARQKMDEILARYGLESGDYSICVCRIEPENNPEMILEAYAESDHRLLFIGNWTHNEWSTKLRSRYGSFKNLLLSDAIYDLDVLYTLRSNARIYVHGHSAGGTNPGLVEAMYFGIPIACYNVVYNKETTGGLAYYFADSGELSQLINRKDLDGSAMPEEARKRYTWRKISEQYNSCF